MGSTPLGIQLSHNRPHVSNDNPFSEAQFKTLKYRPEFPDRFGSFEHALSVFASQEWKKGPYFVPRHFPTLMPKAVGISFTTHVLLVPQPLPIPIEVLRVA
jgi:hypothetical protein